MYVHPLWRSSIPGARGQRVGIRKRVAGTPKRRTGGRSAVWLSRYLVDEPEEDDAIDDDLYSKYADFAEMPAEDDDIDPKQLDESFWTGGSSTK